jgi:hypothetical protein
MMDLIEVLPLPLFPINKTCASVGLDLLLHGWMSAKRKNAGKKCSAWRPKKGKTGRKFGPDCLILAHVDWIRSLPVERYDFLGFWQDVFQQLMISL